jgi:hypothetical protein
MNQISLRRPKTCDTMPWSDLNFITSGCGMCLKRVRDGDGEVHACIPS